jgi:hypothetical protein
MIRCNKQHTDTCEQAFAQQKGMVHGPFTALACAIAESKRGVRLQHKCRAGVMDLILNVSRSTANKNSVDVVINGANCEGTNMTATRTVKQTNQCITAATANNIENRTHVMMMSRL